MSALRSTRCRARRSGVARPFRLRAAWRQAERTTSRARGCKRSGASLATCYRRRGRISQNRLSRIQLEIFDAVSGEDRLPIATMEAMKSRILPFIAGLAVAAIVGWAAWRFLFPGGLRIDLSRPA